jgi:hypothetical protein
MFIALGLIGALWIVGFVIAPDKNAPPMSQMNPPAAVATAAPAPSTPAHQPQQPPQH